MKLGQLGSVADRIRRSLDISSADALAWVNLVQPVVDLTQRDILDRQGFAACVGSMNSPANAGFNSMLFLTNPAAQNTDIILQGFRLHMGGAGPWELSFVLEGDVPVNLGGTTFFGLRDPRGMTTINGALSGLVALLTTNNGAAIPARASVDGGTATTGFLLSHTPFELVIPPGFALMWVNTAANQQMEAQQILWEEWPRRVR